ncbi:hypothetical protein ABK905_02030 [Acerihabitans sp. KWT182]|uniref:Uncharacterized protein n=1 Tax=Acerihabitans sp. KWT182 TaxID=3157919 RepID=A0AAU7QCK9_9GAMM
MVPSKAPISEQNKGYLEVLDALTDIKNIPDSCPSNTLKLLSRKVMDLDESALRKFMRLAVKYYPPATKALLGLILDENGYLKSRLLFKELNPTTRYKIGLEGIWPQAGEWNIL